MKIENSQECFVRLWRQLERTRRLLGGQYKRFCVRNVLRSWFGYEQADMPDAPSFDDFVWDVCRKMTILLVDEDGDDDRPVGGYDMLPLPSLYPRKNRELLRSIVAVRLGIGLRKVDLKALDRAYSIVFPRSTPINVNKKK